MPQVLQYVSVNVQQFNREFLFNNATNAMQQSKYYLLFNNGTVARQHTL